MFSPKGRGIRRVHQAFSGPNHDHLIGVSADDMACFLGSFLHEFERFRALERVRCTVNVNRFYELGWYFLPFQKSRIFEQDNLLQVKP